MESNMTVMEEELEIKHEDLAAIKNQMQFEGKKKEKPKEPEKINGSYMHAGQVSAAVESRSSVPHFGPSPQQADEEDDSSDAPKVEMVGE